jgi:hypothetical protein
MDILAICRPARNVDAKAAFLPYLPAELDALRALHASGVLAHAYSPGSPGAVLILHLPDLQAAHAATAALPLAAAGLIDVELIPLHPIEM